MQRRPVLSWIGVLGACTVWVASAGALAYAMGHGAQTSSLLRAYPPPAAHAGQSHTDFSMLLGCSLFTLLQLTALLLFAFVLRAFWRLRTAVCFSLAAGLVIVGDAAGLFALLVWLGGTLGAS